MATTRQFAFQLRFAGKNESTSIVASFIAEEEVRPETADGAALDPLRTKYHEIRAIGCSFGNLRALSGESPSLSIRNQTLNPQKREVPRSPSCLFSFVYLRVFVVKALLSIYNLNSDCHGHGPHR